MNMLAEKNMEFEQMIEAIAGQRSLDPALKNIEELVVVLEEEEDEFCKAFLAGVLCTVALKSMLTNFGDTDKTINKIENENIKKMLLGVQHARMTLSTF